MMMKWTGEAEKATVFALQHIFNTIDYSPHENQLKIIFQLNHSVFSM